MSRERNLSDFWRCDRSDDRVLELASVLHGADILIGNMGSDIRVAWSGQEVSYTDFGQRIVALDYGPLKDKLCPFPGATVDEVIGYAAHEGGHCLWTAPDKDKNIQRQVGLLWSDLPASFQQEWQRDRQTVLDGLCRIQNILEDAYVDHHVAMRWPVLAEYIRIARTTIIKRTSFDPGSIIGAACADRKGVIDLWLWVSLYGQPLTDLPSGPLRKVMQALLEFTRKATVESNAIARHHMAVDASIVVWRELPQRYVSAGAGSQSTGPALQRSNCTEGKTHNSASDRTGKSASQAGRDVVTNDAGTSPPESSDDKDEASSLDGIDPASGLNKRGRKVTQVPGPLLKRLADAIANEMESISQPVSRCLAEDPAEVAARVRKASYDAERATRVTAQIRREAQEMQQVFRRQQDLRACWLHGLDRGKLDDRRLWKPFVGDPGYYKRKDVLRGPNMAVGLLLDVSGSMTPYMPVVEQTVAIFYQGLIGMPGMNFAAWCYTGQSARVALTRICDRRSPLLCLGRLEDGGGTPSGAAIASVKVLLERMPEKRKLLIHFTDGRPDSAAHLLKAAKACGDSNIHIYAVGLSQHSEALCRQYGEGNYETIQAVPELPQAMARIVKSLKDATRHLGRGTSVNKKGILKGALE